MDIKDKYWIIAAGAIAIASIALSAFIVTFAPADPYAAKPAQTLRADGARPGAIAQPGSTTTSVANRDGRRAAELRAAPHVDLGANAVYAAVGVIVTLTFMFGVFAWGDRRAAAREKQTARQIVTIPPRGAGHAHLSMAMATTLIEERRRAAGCADTAATHIAIERRQTHRRIVDAMEAAARPYRRTWCRNQGEGSMDVV